MNIWARIKNVPCAASLGIKLVEVVIFVAAFCKVPIRVYERMYRGIFEGQKLNIIHNIYILRLGLNKLTTRQDCFRAVYYNNLHLRCFFLFCVCHEIKYQYNIYYTCTNAYT